MEQEYPNPCCRCGFCCITETCPVGIKLYNLEIKNQRCPALGFDPDGTAICYPFRAFIEAEIREDLVKNLFGIGTGCCISARCFKDGKVYGFASLPDEMKKKIVGGIKP